MSGSERLCFSGLHNLFGWQWVAMMNSSHNSIILFRITEWVEFLIHRWTVGHGSREQGFSQQFCKSSIQHLCHIYVSALVILYKNNLHQIFPKEEWNISMFAVVTWLSAAGKATEDSQLLKSLNSRGRLRRNSGPPSAIAAIRRVKEWIKDLSLSSTLVSVYNFPFQIDEISL